MTIKSSGLIGISDINVELAFNSNTPKTLNDSDVRTLLGKASGFISLSDAYGKTKTITSKIATLTLGTAEGWNYINGWFTLYGWSDGSIPEAEGVFFGSVSPTPFSTLSGAVVKHIMWSNDGILSISTLTPVTNIKIKIDGITYTLNLYTQLSTSYLYYVDMVVNPFNVVGIKTVEFLN